MINVLRDSLIFHYVGPASSPTNLSVVLNSSLAVVSFQPPVYGAECVDYYTVTAISEETDIMCTATSDDPIHKCSIPPNTNVNDCNFIVYSVTSGVDGALHNGSIATCGRP